MHVTLLFGEQTAEYMSSLWDHTDLLTFTAVNFHPHADLVEPVYRTKAHIASCHMILQMMNGHTRWVDVSGEDLRKNEEIFQEKSYLMTLSII